MSPNSAASVIVLAGGTSTRFGGSDKTAAHFPGSPHSILDGLLLDLSDTWPVIVVAAPRPVARPDVQFVREDPPGGGPLAGIAAGLTRIDTDIVVVLAGDQPFAGRLAPRLVDALASANQAIDAVAATIEPPSDDTDHSDNRQPNAQLLLAAYRCSALRQAVPTDPANIGVYRALRALRVATMPVPSALGFDIDTPADLHRAGRLTQLPD